MRRLIPTDVSLRYSMSETEEGERRGKERERDHSLFKETTVQYQVLTTAVVMSLVCLCLYAFRDVFACQSTLHFMHISSCLTCVWTQAKQSKLKK